MSPTGGGVGVDRLRASDMVATMTLKVKAPRIAIIDAGVPGYPVTSRNG